MIRVPPSQRTYITPEVLAARRAARDAQMPAVDESVQARGSDSVGTTIRDALNSDEDFGRSTIGSTTSSEVPAPGFRLGSETDVSEASIGDARISRILDVNRPLPNSFVQEAFRE